METKNELVKVIEQSGLETQTASVLMEKFSPFLVKAIEWKKKAFALVVTSADQRGEMKMAREARLALKNIRVEADKTRKLLKEDSLRYGKAVQGIYNVIEGVIAPIEEHLDKQERFVEIQEEEKRRLIAAAREVQLQPYRDYVPSGLDLGGMPDVEYSKILDGAKLQLQAKIDADARMEREKMEVEKRLVLEAKRRNITAPISGFIPNYPGLNFIEMSEEYFINLCQMAEEKRNNYLREQEKIRLENERLKAELEEDNRRMAEERRIALEKLMAEKQAREALEAEKRVREEEERQARDAENARLLKELHAQDRTKLNKLADIIEAISLPELKHEESRKILESVKILLGKTASYIRDNTKRL